MQKIRISAVSFLNTIPFIYGIQNSELLNNKIVLSLDIPSICAKKLIKNQVDIGLIPIAVLPEIENANIISDYCIGADGAVSSVLLVSQVPLQEIKSVYLDYHSRTSIELVRQLSRNYWNIHPVWMKAQSGYENEIKGNCAGIIIGDRTFEYADNFEYVYDLSEEWKKNTDLPFVFAAWVANKEISAEFITAFEKALHFGISNIPKAITHFQQDFSNVNTDIRNYLEKKISYSLDEKKQQGMKLFLSKL